jgi:23S rRNA (uracil1939-C5)-methyltransferase
MICSYSKNCSGCSYWELSYQNQIQIKIDKLKSVIGNSLPIEFKSIDQSTNGIQTAQRDFINFTFENGKYGLYSKDKSVFEIVDLSHCLQMSPLLDKLYQNFRKIKLPIQRGSFKLRVSPTGQAGIWLDFANTDVKTILNNHETMTELNQLGLVEMGQKNKRVFFDDVEKKWKLQKTPILHNWMNTISKDNTEIALYNTIAGFSQSGHKANKIIIKTLNQWTADNEINQFVEFGCGNGNLTLPILSKAAKAHVFEVNHIAIEGLKQSLKQYNFMESVTLNCDNFQIKDPQINWQNFDFILLNPPRSGIGNFLSTTPKGLSASIFYMSCYLESFEKDYEQLKSLGYQLDQVAIVDQFPQTEHFEILSFFKLKPD